MFLLDLFEILPRLSKQYFLYFVKAVALAQPYENDIAEKWDPEPKTSWRDPKVEHGAGTLSWNPGLGSYRRTLSWDPTTGSSSGTVGWDPKMNDKIKV